MFYTNIKNIYLRQKKISKEIMKNGMGELYEIDFFIQLVYCEWVILRLGHEYNQLLSIKLGIVLLHTTYQQVHIQFKNFRLLLSVFSSGTLNSKFK